MVPFAPNNRRPDHAIPRTICAPSTSCGRDGVRPPTGSSGPKQPPSAATTCPEGDESSYRSHTDSRLRKHHHAQRKDRPISPPMPGGQPQTGHSTGRGGLPIRASASSAIRFRPSSSRKVWMRTEINSPWTAIGRGHPFHRAGGNKCRREPRCHRPRASPTAWRRCGLPPIRAGRYRYYDGMWYMMGFLHCGGQFRIWPPK